MQMKSLFWFTCALSQKTLKSSDEYPIMDLPWLLTMHLTTAVIMNGHKSRHKFKTWEVQVWCQECLTINKDWLPLNIFKACVDLVLKLAKFIAHFSFAGRRIYSISLGSLELCGNTQISALVRATQCLYQSQGNQNQLH